MPLDNEFKQAFEKLQNDAVSAVAELRKMTEEGKSNSADNAAKVSNIEKIIDKFEAKNQELSAQIAADKKEKDELKEAVAEIEKKLYRLPTAGSLSQEKESPAYKAWTKAMQFGFKDMNHELTTEELKYLRTDNDAAGGYLVPNIQVQELDKDIVEISPIRAYARIRQTTGRSLPIAIRTTLMASGMTGEGESSTDVQNVYRVVEVPVKKITAETAISLEELQDAAFDMESILQSDIVEEFARKEGAQFVNGTGAADDMTGFMVDTQVSQINSGIADDIQFDNFFSLTDIKVGYNLVYAMNRKTKIRVQKMKDGDGRYLWEPSVEQGQPATINGLNYFIAQDMDNIAANKLPIICGDFSKGFTIVDRIGIAVVRDELTQASKGLVRFIAHKRVGSKVTKGEAFLILKCST